MAAGLFGDLLNPAGVLSYAAALAGSDGRTRPSKRSANRPASPAARKLTRSLISPAGSREYVKFAVSMRASASQPLMSYIASKNLSPGIESLTNHMAQRRLLEALRT